MLHHNFIPTVFVHGIQARKSWLIIRSTMIVSFRIQIKLITWDILVWLYNAKMHYITILINPLACSGPLTGPKNKCTLSVWARKLVWYVCLCINGHFIPYVCSVLMALTKNNMRQNGGYFWSVIWLLNWIIRWCEVHHFVSSEFFFV